jgi:hypothetical protein
MSRFSPSHAAILIGLSVGLPAQAAEHSSGGADDAQPKLLMAPLLQDAPDWEDHTPQRDLEAEIDPSPAFAEPVAIGDDFYISFSRAHAPNDDSSFRFISGGIGYTQTNYGVAVEFGSFGKPGGLLAHSIQSGMPMTDEGDTGYARLGGSLGVTRDTGIHMGASLGLSGYGDEGRILSGAGIGSPKLSLGVSTRRLVSDNDTFSLSITSPSLLALGDGGASEDGSGGRLPTAPLELDATGSKLPGAPIDIEMGYDYRLSKGRISFGGTYSIGDEEPKIGARLGVALQF